MDKACELINKIQDFDQNIHQLTEVYEQSQSIMDEIVLAATYSEIDLRICQNLKDYLNGVVQNKLNHCQQLITKKQKQPKENSVVQTFEHKIANVLKNTVHPIQQDSQPPIYNMRETIDQLVCRSFLVWFFREKFTECFLIYRVIYTQFFPSIQTYNIYILIFCLTN